MESRLTVSNNRSYPAIARAPAADVSVPLKLSKVSVVEYLKLEIADLTLIKILTLFL